MHEVIVRTELPTSLSWALATAEDVKHWKHLQALDLPTGMGNDVGIELLVGMDNPQAFEPLEVRAGGDGAPFAVRTRLGWTVNGPLGYPRLSPIAGCSVLEVPRRRESQLEVQVRRFWELETVAERTKPYEETAMSIDDKRVLKLWEASLRLVAGHYQLPIPFRKERPEFPNNYGAVEHRLLNLRRRLQKNATLRERYNFEVQQMLTKGYAEIVPSKEIKCNPDFTWYLPHHPVFNPNKPEKLRIVFDCAAVHDAISLNGQALQGPDLTNKLLGILLRFRQGRVALMADIEAMFHQIKVTPQHRDALRFLWWTDGKLSQKPSVYRLTVHPFGGGWSPSCAAFALQRAIGDQEQEFPEACERARQNFYVDDLLISMDNVAEASTVACQLRVLLERKGFRLTKWMSTDRAVISSIPERERHADAKEVDLSHMALPTQRALGVKWDLQRDHFAIHVDIRNKPATKRGLLSVVSSVYDPLGFVSPYTIRAKMIFQDECRRKADWDEPLTEDNRHAWELWKEGLKEVAHVSIPRCYIQETAISEGTLSVQLHHFSDASEKAYGTVSYLRFVSDERLHCSFICGKARLAPLKQQTIPRLELCAAVLAVKMDQYLKRELELRIQKTVFWTDSMLVLQYISNTEKRFRTFVANRVSIIRELSTSCQWRHVPSQENPADDATRGLPAKEMTPESRWMTGPAFLWTDESTWPEQRVWNDYVTADPDVIRCSAAASIGEPAVAHEEKVFTTLWTRYSSWHRLQKGVAWIIRFLDWLRHKPKSTTLPSYLTVDELRRARRAILHQLQLEIYPKEQEALKHGKPLARSSSIYRIEPWLDEHGLLRIGGRLDDSSFNPTKIGPILLPREHAVTKLILRDIHQTWAGHSGREHTLALARQQYWIPQPRRLLDKVLKGCFVCRRNNWKPTKQRQAPLPEDRVRSGDPPFSSSGVDCFGPFLIKQGRKRLKRWGCIFTCLTTRAVHLEVLTSLDADAFLNALTRFSARRGVPARLRSDNGTNMTAADKELKTAMRQWGNDGNLRAKLLMREIEWTFNPPTASSMGGIWERQIRTVRKVLRAVVGSQVLDDERLHTLLCETEAVVNSRPITPASEDPQDLEALTPNHILRVGPHNDYTLGALRNEEHYRRRWKHVQFLADQFWKRWLKEYLPLLRQRSGPLETRRRFKKGDLVIVTSGAVPRNQWNLGRIVHVQPGIDGIVRQVKVRTARNVLVRPVTKLCFLEGLYE